MFRSLSPHSSHGLEWVEQVLELASEDPGSASRSIDGVTLGSTSSLPTVAPLENSDGASSTRRAVCSRVTYWEFNLARESVEELTCIL